MLELESLRLGGVPPRRARLDVTSGGGGDGGVSVRSVGCVLPGSCLVGVELTRPGTGGVGAGRTGPGEKIGGCGAREESATASVGTDGV